MNDRPTASTINDQQLDELHDALDGAYRERAHLVALLTTHYRAVIAPALDLDEAGWWIAYLTIGGRQCSWHISPRDAGLFAHVERVEPDDPRARWDGHTTDAKYEWLRKLAERAPVPGPAATEPDTCRPVEVDGQTIRVRGSGQFTEQDQEFAADIVRAAKRKYAAEHPEEQPMPVCTAAIEGPHTPGDQPIQCTREAGHPENHVGPNQDGDGRTLWTDHNAGATPHQTSSEEHH